MGWFDEQIKLRRENDDAVMAEAIAGIAGAVMGSRVAAAAESDSYRAQNAISDILRFHHIKASEVPESIKDFNEQLEFLLRPHGIMRRAVKLEKGWYKDAVGAMLAVRKSDGAPVSLLPAGLTGYTYFDEEKGRRVRVTAKTQQLFEDEAIAFYAAFPLKKMGIKELTVYIIKSLSLSDIVLYAMALLAVTLIGMLSPKLTQLIFSDVLDSGNLRVLLAIAVFMVCVSTSQLLIRAMQSLLMARINTKMELAVEAAAMMRLLSLPADFFKQYSSGELASRMAGIRSLCTILISTALSTGLLLFFP